MNMSPARMSGMNAYTARQLAGMGDFLDYLTIADTGAEGQPVQLSGPDMPTDVVTSLPASLPTSGGIDWNKVISAGKELFVGAQSADIQRQVLNLNLERAKRGLPPISAASISPQVGVSVGVQPDTKKLLVYTGAGLAIAYFVGQLLKRSRR